MRLKEYQRDRIVSTLVAVTFKDREAAREAEERRLALAILKTQVTASEIGAMEALPAKFFATDTYLYASRQLEGRSNFHLKLRLPVGTRVPYFVDQATIIIDDDALYAELVAFTDSNKKLAQDARDFEEQTRGVVRTFSSSEKLLAAWPVIAEIMPADYFKEREKPSLPTTQIDALDALVQGARPFETEAAAA